MGEPFSSRLHGAPAADATSAVIGATQVFAAFEGGVPVGQTCTPQFWLAEAAAVAGMAASSAVAISP